MCTATGMEPTDARIPEGRHIVAWVYETRVRDFAPIGDQQNWSTQTEEEMVQVLGIALLCVNACPDEGCGDDAGNDESGKANSREAAQCSSFSRLSFVSPLHSH